MHNNTYPQVIIIVSLNVNLHNWVTREGGCRYLYQLLRRERGNKMKVAFDVCAVKDNNLPQKLLFHSYEYIC